MYFVSAIENAFVATVGWHQLSVTRNVICSGGSFFKIVAVAVLNVTQFLHVRRCFRYYHYKIVSVFNGSSRRGRPEEIA
jgi:hypothetical protein